MLRYLYLIYLLTVIKYSHSQTHAHVHHSKYNNFEKQRQINEMLNRYEYNHKLKDSSVGNIRKEFIKGNEGKEKTAQIDVASFVQSSDYFSNDERLQDEREKQRRLTRKYNNDYELSREMNRREIMETNNDSHDYFNLDEDNSPELNNNIVSFKEEFNTNDIHTDPVSKNKFSGSLDTRLDYRPLVFSYPNDKPVIVNPRHSSGNKSSLRNWKIPFFFRNRSTSLKPKKDKKRKIFCLTCNSKKDCNGNEIQKSTVRSNNYDNNLLFDVNSRIQKRSDVEILCPACKEKYMRFNHLHSRNKRNRIRNKFIHNSRHFFQKSNNNLTNDLKNEQRHGRLKDCKTNSEKYSRTTRKHDTTQKVTTSEDNK